jgi:hypothetical protein
VSVCHRRELQAIESQQQGKENHAVVLEKEMSAALVELQALVKEGRSSIQKQVSLAVVAAAAEGMVVYSVLKPIQSL